MARNYQKVIFKRFEFFALAEEKRGETEILGWRLNIAEIKIITWKRNLDLII